MRTLRLSLLISTVLIYSFTYLAISSSGFNWPAVVISDLSSLDWRSQFDFDFLIHLFLMALWVCWREGFTPKGYAYGALSIVMGGMFSFPYIVYAILSEKGDPRRLLLGVNAV